MNRSFSPVVHSRKRYAISAMCGICVWPEGTEEATQANAPRQTLSTGNGESRTMA
jgi:hypothetical protein